MIVADASATVDMLVDDGKLGQRARAVLGSDSDWTVPDHWLVETFSAIRRLAVNRKLNHARATDIVAHILRLGVDSVPVRDLMPRMWEFKDSFTAYDAAYVALAEARELTLVTSDGRLARGATPYCRVHLVA